MDVWCVWGWWEATDTRGLAGGELGAVTRLACGGGQWGVVGVDGCATVVVVMVVGVRLDVDDEAEGGGK